MRISGTKIAVASLSLAVLVAQELPPLPSELPVAVPSAPSSPVPVRRIAPGATPGQQITLPRFPNAPSTSAVARVSASYQPRTVGDNILQWDETSKDYTAKAGEPSAIFSFAVTNISTTNVVINWVRPSCGCTVAKLPPVPWTLKPGEGGTIDFEVDLRGKYGVLSKYVSIDTSEGQKILTTRVNIPQISTAEAGMDSRERNLQLAKVDRQIVFRGDCASCHSIPTMGKMGEQLYQTACAICHDAPHRASMVPDLHALKNATGKDYWVHWITHGKPGTLMPGFAKMHGGPLSDQQIQSLAEFIFHRFPRADGATTAASEIPGALKVLGSLSLPPTLPAGGSGGGAN